MGARMLPALPQVNLNWRAGRVRSGLESAGNTAFKD
jgi:hypothetical protein